MTRVATEARIRRRRTDCPDARPVDRFRAEQWKAVTGKLAFLER